MWSPFHGWRRKAGCVALVVACFLFIAWTRSLIVSDAILGRSRWISLDSEGKTYDLIVSRDGAVRNIYRTSQMGGGFRDEEVFAVSYAIVILPLTLLSAYLILWKPRKRLSSDQISNINSN
ncbi:MAG TPA: hypothetical protein VGM98_23370 [Schlesneria sp.]|jgi:hypothetical protein